MPPHLRAKSIPIDGATSVQSERKPEDGYTLVEIANQFGCKHKVGTLNSNSEKGVDWDHSSLAFIVIFGHPQHPQWPPKIFCKTNLNLLPPSTGASNGTSAKQVNNGDNHEEDESHGLSGPIPVFTEIYVPGFRAEKRFVFDHYYCITHVEYLAPESKELIAMLDTKFTPERKQRSAEAWKNSLAVTWAVVTLEEAKPKVEAHPMVPLKEVKTKSVTEILAELRLGDGNQSPGRFKKQAIWGKDKKDTDQRETDGDGPEEKAERTQYENRAGNG